MISPLRCQNLTSFGTQNEIAVVLLMSITTAVDAAGRVDIVATSQILRPSGVPGVFELASQGSMVGQDFPQAGGLGIPIRASA